MKNGNTTNAGATFTGVAERNGKVLLVTVMNPEKDEHNEVYKEAARLLDWGFSATGKVTPVGELVPPKGVDTGAQAGATASAGSNTPVSTGDRGPRPRRSRWLPPRRRRTAPAGSGSPWPSRAACSPWS